MLLRQTPSCEGGTCATHLHIERKDIVCDNKGCLGGARVGGGLGVEGALRDAFKAAALDDGGGGQAEVVPVDADGLRRVGEIAVCHVDLRAACQGVFVSKAVVGAKAQPSWVACLPLDGRC